jgi:metal-responsive CopG/Arc/MetJ family transcriptional regulator
LRKNYVTVKIPSELAERLEDVIKRESYHSRAEIVNDAIRRFIEDKKRIKVDSRTQGV